MSSAFALMADVCVGVLGGTLKRREKISGRLADALSNMYVMTAVLKHYEDQGSQKEDLALLRWVCEDALVNIQTALKDITKNLPVPVVGTLCNFIIFPLTKPYQKPGDSLGRHVARKFCNLAKHWIDYVKVYFSAKRKTMPLDVFRMLFLSYKNRQTTTQNTCSL